MKPDAKPFFDAAVFSWDHARSHSVQADPADSAQVYLSLDHMGEMLAKATLLERGESILDSNGKTIHLPAALTRLGYTPHETDVRILRDNRNALQHTARYSTHVVMADLLESVRRFAATLATKDFPAEGQPFGQPPPVARVPPGLLATPKVFAELAKLPGRPIDRDPRPQRDAAFGGGVLAWAEQASATDGSLLIKVREESGVRTLTAAGGFEYMPQTDGASVAAYRQRGGVVIYDLLSGRRSVLSDTGGPGAVAGGIVAAQGVTVSDGLAGGVWFLGLAPGRRRYPTQVSPGGDSPRLGDGKVVWQEFTELLEIRIKPIIGERVVKVAEGGQPAMDGSLLAWVDGAGSLWARDLFSSGTPVHIADDTFGPDVRGNRIAYLAGTEQPYSLAVFDWSAKRVEWTLADVDFPTGRGPILTDRSVVWEAGQRIGMGHLREHVF